MQPTTLHLHTAFEIAPVDPRIFGGFLEHMGRAVYEGVYEPDSPHADAEGCRTDVLDALRKLDFSVMRYPGGNFVSGYHWEDGIGPRDTRPTREERAWRNTEPNTFGTDEFMSLCRRMGWVPMIAANLGTGTADEAAAWVEYCNGAADVPYGAKRIAHGASEPHQVQLWCLGNEMDGPWQIGHAPADEYGTRARDAARAMRAKDTELEFVVCGSSGPHMGTYLEWERTVLAEAREAADYISLHRYVGNWSNDTPEYLGVTNSIDRQIEDVDAVCRSMQTQTGRAKRTYLSFDEWNVWYKTFGEMDDDAPREFPAHLIEEVYNLEDALVFAGFLNSFIRHADSVKIANLAQIVNVIAPILTRGDEMLLQSIYDVFRMYSTRRTGTALRPAIEGPRYEAGVFGEVTYVDCSAILDGSRLTVFATNRSLDEQAECRIILSGAEIQGMESAELLTGPDAKAANTFDDPHAVRSVPYDNVRISDGAATAVLPPLSVAAMTFQLGR